MRPAPWIILLGILNIVQIASGRITEGLVAFYDFSLEKGKVVKDRSGASEAMDLEIQDHT